MEDQDILKELESIVETESTVLKNEWKEEQYSVLKLMGDALTKDKIHLTDGAYLLVANHIKGDALTDGEVKKAVNYDQRNDMGQSTLNRVSMVHKFKSVENFLEISSDINAAMQLHVMKEPDGVFVRLYLGKNKTLDVFAQSSWVTIRRKTRFVDEFLIGQYGDKDEYEAIEKALSDANLELVRCVVSLLKLPEYLHDTDHDQYEKLRDRTLRLMKEEDND